MPPPSGNGMRTEEVGTMQRDLDQRLLARAVDLWEEWAQAHYPDDVGDVGWDESMVDEWLAEVRRGVLEIGDVRRAPHRPA
ncbi:MAG TPA: hypothetical protein VFH38_10365 [Jatrophihabitans sp.]|nr:hypothetical protein [Jatrophihabitans sp.]